MPSGLLWNHHLWHGLRRGAPRRKGLLSGEAQICIWDALGLGLGYNGISTETSEDVVGRRPQRYRDTGITQLPRLVVTCSFELNPITPQFPVLSNNFLGLWKQLRVACIYRGIWGPAGKPKLITREAKTGA